MSEPCRITVDWDLPDPEIKFMNAVWQLVMRSHEVSAISDGMSMERIAECLSHLAVRAGNLPEKEPRP